MSSSTGGNGPGEDPGRSPTTFRRLIAGLSAAVLLAAVVVILAALFHLAGVSLPLSPIKLLWLGLGVLVLAIAGYMAWKARCLGEIQQRKQAFRIMRIERAPTSTSAGPFADANLGPAGSEGTVAVTAGLECEECPVLRKRISEMTIELQSLRRMMSDGGPEGGPA